jgi:hypothetical protein
MKRNKKIYGKGRVLIAFQVSKDDKIRLQKEADARKISLASLIDSALNFFLGEGLQNKKPGL